MAHKLLMYRTMAPTYHSPFQNLSRNNIIGIGPSFLVYCDSNNMSTNNSPTTILQPPPITNVSKRTMATKPPVDYQYLEKSELPTMKFQKSLPRLPIPKLEKTIERYLSALEPIIEDKEQYNRTVAIANKFKDTDGKSLHDQLVKEDKANKHTSYISKPWFDMYLKSRAPLVLNFNPFMAWKDDPDEKFMRVDIRAANMVISALRFRRSLIEGKAAPEVFHLSPKTDTPKYRKIMKLIPDSIAFYASALMYKAYALDMSQFNSLFSLTRVPKKYKDELQSYPNSKHVVFIKNGQFYAFDVLNAQGDIKPPAEIFSAINHIVKNITPTGADSITVLSAEDRNVWAHAREHLISSNITNSNSLAAVDSALFTVSLDDLTFDPDKERLDAAHNFLHGNSIKQGARPLNRWFDKSLGLLFDADGHASITFEHSWGDGVAVLRAFNDIYKDSTTNHFVGADTNVDAKIAAEVKHLKFELDEKSKKHVSEAREKWDKSTRALDLNYVIYDKMGRNYFKAKKVSPDSMFQLAFQLAFRQIYGQSVPVYESCSTSAFKHGRTEVVRSATIETKATVDAILSNKSDQELIQSAAELRKLLDKCSVKHSQLTKEAAMGQGFDRHLFAMRIIAERKIARPQNQESPPPTQEELNQVLPDLYKDKSYSDCNKYVLSTSSLYGEYFSGGGFGPVVADGFGLGYGYVDDQLGILCSSYKGQRDGKKMVDAFIRSLDMIKIVLENAPLP